MSAANRPVVPRFEHGSRTPGWDESVDLTKPPATVPDPALTPVPEQLRVEIEAGDGAVSGQQVGGDPGAARRSAAARLVLARGDHAGRLRDAR